MKSLNTLAGDALEQMIDYQVVDQAGENIGTLHSLWSDPATGTVEFLGVKTGWLFGHNHVVPAEKAELDNSNSVVRLPYTRGFIKEAPTMSADAEISEAEEDEIFRYYGMPQRNVAAGAAGGGPTFSGSDPFAVEPGGTAAGEEELDASATYVGLPSKPKSALPKDISITDRGDIGGTIYRLRKTVRPAMADHVPSGESLASIRGMTSPTNEDFISGGAAAITDGVGSGSTTEAEAESPLGDSSLQGSTAFADEIEGNSATTLTTGTEAYTDTGNDRQFGHTDPAENPDSITGEPGSHPVGTGAGAAAAGAAGAAVGGVIGGPVGAVVGGVVGAVSGGLAGKGVAESVNPTIEGEPGTTKG